MKSTIRFSSTPAASSTFTNIDSAVRRPPCCVAHHDPLSARADGRNSCAPASTRAAAWTAQQLREAWPWDTAPRFVIRDRDRTYGSDPRRTAQQMAVEEVLTAPRTPWQNPFVERVIGSLRASASTTSSCGTNARYAATCSATSSTTTSGARTSRWTRMPPSRGSLNRQPAARSFESRTSADCITIMNAARPDRRLGTTFP